MSTEGLTYNETPATAWQRLCQRLLAAHWRGLLYKEWLVYGERLVGFWVVWLIGGPLLMIFDHPAWIGALGAAFSLLVVPQSAGMDAQEGTEEFVFSLPPTRQELFRVRLALTGANLLALLAVGLLWIRFSVGQALWGLVVESSFTEPFGNAIPRAYLYAFAIPLAMYGLTFTLSALARSATAAVSYWIVSAVLAGSFLANIMILEKTMWGQATSLVGAPLLLLAACVSLLIGYRAYARKEGLNRPATSPGSKRRWLWLAAIIFVGSMVIASMLGYRLMARSSRSVQKNGARAPAPAEQPTAAEKRPSKAPLHPRHLDGGGQ